jgi:hypothetical protein
MTARLLIINVARSRQHHVLANQTASTEDQRLVETHNKQTDAAVRVNGRVCNPLFNQLKFMLSIAFLFACSEQWGQIGKGRCRMV